MQALSSALTRVQPFTYFHPEFQNESRVYTLFSQNVTPSTAFITSQRNSEGSFVLVRANAISDSRPFLYELVAKHAELRDQISYLLFHVRQVFPGYRISNIVKAVHQHGISDMQKFSASHSCLSPHLIDNFFPSLIEKIVSDLSNKNGISKETKAEIEFLFFGKETQSEPLRLIQSLEEIGKQADWQAEFLKRKSIEKTTSILASRFSEHLNQISLNDSPPHYRLGQISVDLQKMTKPEYEEIQNIAFAKDILQNIGKVLDNIELLLDENSLSFDIDFLISLQGNLRNLEKQIRNSVFIKIETALEPYKRPSIIASNSLMYQNMNITTEFPHYINMIIDQIIEEEMRGFFIYLQNQISEGKLTPREAFVQYSERKTACIANGIELLSRQTQTTSELYLLIRQLRSLAVSLQGVDPSDSTATIRILIELLQICAQVQEQKTTHFSLSLRAFGTLHAQIRELLDPDAQLFSTLDRISILVSTTMSSFHTHLICDTFLRECLEDILRVLQTQNQDMQKAFRNLLASHTLDETQLQTAPPHLIKKILFAWLDYFYDRFHQIQYFESIKNDPDKVQEFYLDLMQTASEKHKETPYQHSDFLAYHFVSYQKGRPNQTFEQTRHLVKGYLIDIYSRNFVKGKDAFKDIFTSIRKIKKAEDNREILERGRKAFKKLFETSATPSPLELMMQELGIPSFPEATQGQMQKFLDRLAQYLTQFPEHILLLRDVASPSIKEIFVKYAAKDFPEKKWEEFRELLEKCRETLEIQKRNALIPSDLPALERHFFVDQARSQEQIIKELVLKPAYVFLKPTHLLCPLVSNPHRVDITVLAKLRISPNGCGYSVLETSPPGYANHPSLEIVLKSRESDLSAGSLLLEI